MTTLVIEREKWLRGQADESTLLRPSDGKMCCLGFYGIACGLMPEQIGHVGTPSDTPESARWPTWLLEYVDERGYHVDTKACNDLIHANDTAALLESEREAQIASIFAKHGVTVVFK